MFSTTKETLIGAVDLKCLKLITVTTCFCMLRTENSLVVVQRPFVHENSDSGWLPIHLKTRVRKKKPFRSEVPASSALGSVACQKLVRANK